MVLSLGHGLLITRLNMQPFIVTLCGLLFYRGLARFITNDETKGFGSVPVLIFFGSSRMEISLAYPCRLCFCMIISRDHVARAASLSLWPLSLRDRAQRGSSALCRHRHQEIVTLTYVISGRAHRDLRNHLRVLYKLSFAR